MNIIPESLQRKIAEYRRKTGTSGLCIENVEFDSSTWNKILQELNLPNEPVYENDFEKWFYHNPDETLRIWLDKLPTDKGEVNTVLIYAKPEIIQKLKEKLNQ